MQTSRSFGDWLRRSWLFGRMIRDWRSHRPLRFDDTIMSIVMNLTLVALGGYVFELSDPVFLFVLMLAALEVAVMLLISQFDARRPALTKRVEPAWKWGREASRRGADSSVANSTTCGWRNQRLKELADHKRLILT